MPPYPPDVEITRSRAAWVETVAALRAAAIPLAQEASAYRDDGVWGLHDLLLASATALEAVLTGWGDPVTVRRSIRDWILTETALDAGCQGLLTFHDATVRARRAAVHRAHDSLVRSLVPSVFPTLPVRA